MEFEIASGIISGATVAPLVSIVDKAIFSNASGKATVMESFKQSFGELIKHPGQFLKGPTFLWIWAVYGSTYVASNCVERSLLNQGVPKEQVGSHVAKFVAASATNIGMSMFKDRAFTRMFGVTAPRPLPPLSLACYGARDVITIAASFTLVDPIGRLVASKLGIDNHSATLLAQVFCPLLAQALNTPIFLYGMNLYNQPNSTPLQHRQFIFREYGKTLACRLARIAPAFSIGGVLNRLLRAQAERFHSPPPPPSSRLVECE